MIVFDLSCDEGHTFEGWFSSSADYADQIAHGLVTCPICGSEDVVKAPMAPAVPTKGNSRSDVVEGPVVEHTASSSAQPIANTPMPKEVTDAFAALAKAQAKALEKSEWVGDKFADKARSMHYGESDAAPIHGQATREEAEDLLDEGVSVAPLIVPVAPPDELN